MAANILGEEIYVFSSQWIRYDGNAFVYRTGDLQWKLSPNLILKDAIAEDFFYFEIECLPDYASNLWDLHMEVHISVKNKRSNAFHNELYSANFNASNRKKGFEYGTFGMIREEVAPRNEDLQDVFIETLILIKKESVGIRKYPLSDFSYPKSFIKRVESEVILLVGKRKLYLDKYALMCFSSVFRDMLSHGTNDFQIEDDTEYEHFLVFFRLIYRQSQQITEVNIDKILEFSIRYDVQFLISDCEDFLLSTDEISIVEKLRIAEKYGLSRLQLEVLEKITKTDIERFYGISTQTLQVLLSTLCVLKDSGTNT